MVGPFILLFKVKHYSQFGTLPDFFPYAYAHVFDRNEIVRSLLLFPFLNLIY